MRMQKNHSFSTFFWLSKLKVYCKKAEFVDKKNHNCLPLIKSACAFAEADLIKINSLGRQTRSRRPIDTGEIKPDIATGFGVIHVHDNFGDVSGQSKAIASLLPIMGTDREGA